MLPNRIFCQVDSGLVSLIRRLAKGRTVIDCGCGVGLLGSMLPGVISVDIEERETPLIDDILVMDVLAFPFREEHFPVFLRPCHGHWVRMSMRSFEPVVSDCLYVSRPENLADDVDTEAYRVMELDGWTGAEGERAYLVTLKTGETKRPLKRFVKVRYMKTVYWFEVRTIDGQEWLVNGLGGRMPFRPDTDHEVLGEAQAEHQQGLDWTGTCFDDPTAEDGWLSPDARYWGSGYQSHNEAAYLALKKDPDELLAEGWGEVHQANAFSGRFCRFADDREATPAQRRWLVEHGIEVDD